MDDFIDFIKIVGGTLGLCAAIVGGIGVCVAIVGNEIDSNACQQYHKTTGKEISYSFTTGCLMNIDGRWMKADAYLHNQTDIRVK